MWNGLFAGLISLLTPPASLPSTAAIEQEMQQFAQVYDIGTQRIQVQESTLKSASPFLTHSGTHTCTVHINQHPDAKQLWATFLNTTHQNAEIAFIAFTLGHEVTHCLLSENSKRETALRALENHLGIQFSSNLLFEETLADLIGLAYVQQVAPQHYNTVHRRVKAIRIHFSNQDPDHNSSNLLTHQSIAFASQMFRKTTSINMADASSP